MGKAEVAEISLLDLLAHSDPEIRRLAQEILNKLVECITDDRTRLK